MFVRDAFGVRAAITLELRFDPVYRGAVAIRSGPSVTECGESFDRGLVALKIQARDHEGDRIGTVNGNRLIAQHCALRRCERGLAHGDRGEGRDQ